MDVLSSFWSDGTEIGKNREQPRGEIDCWKHVHVCVANSQGREAKGEEEGGRCHTTSTKNNALTFCYRVSES